jgi:acyl-CoA synthetase (NDP forming)/GNAT superfamily N-acetyltransferase
MPIRNLDKMFFPRAIAVVGATNREGSHGLRVMHNLLHGGFEGPIMPVSREDRAIAGVLSYSGVDDLPITADLAVVTEPAELHVRTIADLGRRGTRAAILIGDAAPSGAPSKGIQSPAGRKALLDAAAPYGLRILGPDCLGVMVPGIGMNASVSHRPPAPGPLAFVSQSSTIASGVLDWAAERDIGFSYIITLGDTADVDFSDVIDYLGNDPFTRAIMLYVESVRVGRSFMSAARGAARNKPILVIKSGRTKAGARSIVSAAVAGGDAVYDAAFRRAGMLRVNSFGELFAAVETLARSRPTKAERLVMIANGGGMAGLATDSLILAGGHLAKLTPETESTLTEALPPGTRVENPIILDGNAPASAYRAALQAVASAPEANALMVLHAPTSTVSSTEIAAVVVETVKNKRRVTLTSWMGGERVAEARHMFAEAGVPTYDSPTQAVAAFMHLVLYSRNRDILMETPLSTPVEFTPRTDAARAVVDDALSRGETQIGAREATTILSAYGIRSAISRIVRSAGLRPGTHEVKIAVSEDPVFGPVITFGQGGPAADIIGDQAVGLPPLNMSLAHELISRTRLFRLMQGYRDFPAADIDALCLTLVQVSQMIVEVPEIVGLEIDPLFVDCEGCVAIEAHIRLAPAAGNAEDRLAIRPYPKFLEENYALADGRAVLIRPIRPEDEPAHYEFLSKVTAEDLRLRFFHLIRTLPHAEMARLTQIDYDREMAFIAALAGADGAVPETVGVVRTITDPNNDKAEYAILVRSDMKGQGLGWKLMDKMVQYCRGRRTKEINGLVMRDNKRMLDLVHGLGFTSRKLPDEDVMEVVIDLQRSRPAPAAIPMTPPQVRAHA